MGAVKVFSATDASDLSDLSIEQALKEKDVVINSNTDERSNQKLIRNVCILAHVDHGKTTLADNLIASHGGGVLHPNQVGERRFMDYLDEERRRAITMKSSAISLLFKDHSVNLIDSPGHMDFCGEVSSAARLSDGALVVVDAVDGVQIQTHAVLRQAWIEKLTPCLVLNKIDQMSWKLRLSPVEAYERLKMILDVVNRIVSGYKSEQYLLDIDSAPSTAPSSEKNLEEEGDGIFQPQKGNVVFSSAIHGWGFRISDFAELLAPKSRSSVDTLQKDLWPLYSDKKPKKKPMFPHYILKPIWEMYETIFDGSGTDGLFLQKVVRKLNLSIPSRELQSKDPKAVFKSVMSRWLPLSDAILSMVVECIPDPISAQSFRISRLLPITDSLQQDNDFDAFTEAELVRKSVEVCNSRSSAPCVAFVSKMFAVPTNFLPHGDIVNDLDSPECFLAFARIFSGVLVAGQRIFVLSALYDPLKIESKQNHMQEAEVQGLYLMMGQGLKPVGSAEAGNVIAIKGLGQHILKSATLSSTINCWPFSNMTFQVAPTVKMAVEPSNPADMDAFEKGLRLLNRADPFVEVIRSARGEYILAAAGEVHMERCLKDLRERFAKVSLEVSPPIVYYKETIEDETINLLGTFKMFENCDYVEKTTPNGRCVVRVKVMKLPEPLIKILDESSELLKDILGGKSGQALKNFHGCNVEKNSVEALKNRMLEAVECDFPPGITEIEKDRARVSWIQFFKRIWALGPFQTGPNILITPETGRNIEGSSVYVRGDPYVSNKLGFHESRDSDGMSDEVSSVTNEIFREFEGLESSVLSGFQLATSAGPLCDEPMWGLVFSIEARVFPLDRQPDQDSIFTGQLMIAVKEACRAAVLQSKPRIVEPWYLCELNTTTENLRTMCGRASVFGLLKQKRAQVIGGSSAFSVKAYVPVSESFGLADSLIRQSSGVCTPLLVFGEWRTLHEDPLLVPKSEDEVEKSGDGSSVPQNTARKIIDGVRKQKGLPVEEKVVRHATKQRTLSRK